VHIVQLSPQCAESVAELQALSAHLVLPAGHIEAQRPLLQTCVDKQTVQSLPQCAMSEATHDPPHKTSPDAHTHDPFWQVVPVPQIVPHVPQFWLSVAVSVHSVPHAVWPAPHERPAEVPPSAAGPNPGPAAPVAQLTTTKSAEQTTAANARKEERRPSMFRLLRIGGRAKPSAKYDSEGTTASVLSQSGRTAATESFTQ
jgi:hypothetical protein